MNYSTAKSTKENSVRQLTSCTEFSFWKILKQNRASDRILHRGQMKIQQMAFVLVGVVLLFSMVALFYISVRMTGLKEDVKELRDSEISEKIQRMAVSPELKWQESCASCIDFDKALLLKERKSYEGFWKADFLAIEKLEYNGTAECTKANYPNCKRISLSKKGEIGNAKSAFVAICRQEFAEGTGYAKCELGRIYASAEAVE